MVMPSTAGPAGRGPVPGTTCEVFPVDNVWRMDVSALPKHPEPDLEAFEPRGVDRPASRLRPPAYGIPYGVVDASHADVAVDFRYASESDGPYTFGPDITIEGGSDRHALMLDRDACTLYELFNARWKGGDPTAGSGAIFDLGERLRPAGWTSADAAGLPIFPASFDGTRCRPARSITRSVHGRLHRDASVARRHQAGLSDRRCPPMGARFRLRQGFDISGFSPNARVVLLAMQRYGLIVADNGSDWYLQGTVDDGWTNGLLDQLKEVPAGAFVAVDARGCRVSKDSAEFAYGPDCPAPD